MPLQVQWILSGFGFLLIGLFMALGANHFVYATLISNVVACGLLLYVCWKNAGCPRWPWHVFLPVPYFVFTAMSPGWWFKDLKIGAVMAGAYCIGLGAAFLPRVAIWRAFMALGFVLGCGLVYFYATGQPASMLFGDSRVMLWFYHPNPMSLLCFFVLFYIVCTIDEASTTQKVLSYGVAVVCAILPILGVARSVIPGLALCAPYMLYCFSKKFFISLLCLCAAGALAIPLLSSQQQERLLSSITAPLQDETFQSRLPLWFIASEGIKDSPLVGKSHRGYRVFHKEYLAAHAADMQRTFTNIESVGRHSHNNMLHIVFMGGFVGLILFLVAYLPALKMAYTHADHWFVLLFLFSIGFSLFDVFIHRKDGAFYAFFPLGMVYGRYMLSTWKTNMQKARTA